MFGQGFDSPRLHYPVYIESYRLRNRSIERFFFYIVRYDTIQSDKREGEKEGEKIKKPVY